jgi:hypothetical protein
MCNRLACCSIFVVEAVPCNILHRQPSSKDRACKSWEAILGLRYFGLAKVVEERVWVGGKGRQISRHLTARGQEKSGLRSRGLHGARGVKNGVKGCPKRQLLSRK